MSGLQGFHPSTRGIREKKRGIREVCQKVIPCHSLRVRREGGAGGGRAIGCGCAARGGRSGQFRRKRM